MPMGSFRFVRYFTVFLSLLLPAAWAQGQGAASGTAKRVALVIGNGKYPTAPLKNPVNDARAMAQSLKELGFEVTLRENTSQRDMAAAVRQFGTTISAGATALFYFAGHGMQVRGKNFLVPVDADIQLEEEVPYSTIDVNLVLDKMEIGKSGVNIVILDACRNNPFSRRFRSAATGLAQMDAPIGTLIAFATAPGSVAQDGTGENGVYTRHLLQNMPMPGLPVEQMFKRVRIGVAKDTQETQIPWESSSMKGDFVFKEARVAAAQDRMIEEAVKAAAEKAAALTAERMRRDQEQSRQQSDRTRSEQEALAAEREALRRERERLAAEGESLRQKSAAAPGPVALAAPTAARPASARPSSSGPRPEVGDRWTYRFSDGFRKSLDYVIKVKAVSDDSVIDEMTHGKSRHPGQFEAGLEVASRMVDGIPIREVAPYLQSFGALAESEEWKSVQVAGAGSPFVAKLAGKETVTVPAGRFEATKIVIEGEQMARGAMTRLLTIQVWYAPEVKRFVKAVYVAPGLLGGIAADRDTIELVETSLPLQGKGASAAVAPAMNLASLAPSLPAAAAGALPSVGDSWTYRYQDRVYGKSETYTVQVTAASREEIADEARAGRQRSAASHDEVLAFKERKLGEVGIREISPYLQAQGGLKERPEWKGLQIPGHDLSARLAGTETVKVPAGTFEAQKLVVEGFRLSPTTPAKGRFVLTAWYAPAVKRFVRIETEVHAIWGVGKEQESIELTAFRVQ